MTYPPFLKKGDKIALVSPAGKVCREPVELAMGLLQQEGFVVEVAAHAFGSHYQYSGTDAERAEDLQAALNDSTVKAILCTRGGYGSLRTLELVDWSIFQKNPKWLIGFSDITIFHHAISALNIASIHGVMPAFFFENGGRTDSLERLLRLLRGAPLSYTPEPNPFNKVGRAKGVLTGGNLSLIYNLRGTRLDPDPTGKVLFIEDIAEFDYHLDRMMMNLKYGGFLAQLSGIIVGYFTDTKNSASPFGMTVEEIILDAVAAYDYPVLFGFPAGHELPNYPLVMGGSISMNITGDKVLIEQHF